MPLAAFIPIPAAALVLAQFAGTAVLESLNRNHAFARRNQVPEAFRDVISPETHARSVEYTLAKSRHHVLAAAFETALLLLVLASGILPASFERWVAADPTSAWRGAAWIAGIMMMLSLPSLPFEWWEQFRIEAQFGFNTTTATTWIADRLKGLVLSLALGVPLLALILATVTWVGSLWWLWAWAGMVAVQVTLLFLAPVLILPLFNRFTPLPEGGLRDRLLALGQRTGFNARTIQVMDGSKRSRHANAFFTGFGRFRKIVLFDTLIAQLTEPEIESVLAHEIGHQQLRHIPQRMVWGVVMLLAGFGAMGWLAAQPSFIAAFGFQSTTAVAPALVLFILLVPAVLFWTSPLGNRWSRTHEFEADAYAREAVGSPAPLVSALRKLSEKNLSNLTPHPVYSAFHYSHPTLVEREAALTPRVQPPA